MDTTYLFTAADLLEDRGHPYVCSYENCGKRFSKSSNLTQHIRIHSGEKPYECNKCGRKFRQSGNLTKHLKSHENAHLRWNRNTSEKPFKCPYDNCDKSFTAKSSLQNHIRTHTGDKPFGCPVEGCEERFHVKPSLFTHIRNKHADSPHLLDKSDSNSISSNKRKLDEVTDSNLKAIDNKKEYFGIKGLIYNLIIMF